jgi:ATP-binding cassette subfamily C protein/ATP-binding cassette subfamily C protein EexD
MQTRPSEFWRLLRSGGTYFGTAGAFSLAINLLYLAGPLYMLQVYDRVVPSNSHVTLVMLTFGLVLAYLALAGLDAARALLLTRASVRLDRRVTPRLMEALIDVTAVGPAAARGQLLRDFDSVRQFVSGSGIHAVFDLPWAPIYIAVICMLHWSLGVFALGCSLLLIALALVNEWLVHSPLSAANAAAARNYGFTDMCLRNVEAIRAMGMTEGLLGRWRGDRHAVLQHQVVASDRAAVMQSLMRFLRLSMQSLILGLGAYLVIERSATAGTMFAASLLLGRALQPVEQVTGAWRSFISVGGAIKRLGALLSVHPSRNQAVALPRPRGALCVENLTSVAPGSNKPILHGVSFEVASGEVLGLVGPSGAGKSSLVRQLVGVLPPSAGVVRLDGADVWKWARNGLGSHVGYLPQDIELFSDTVAANINRFRLRSDEATIAAAKLAGVHELILRLPQGYETPVGEGGAILSGGVRQRIALARAVYGNPSLVVLDEPSSNLDSDGDRALTACILELKRRGVTVIVVSHRPQTVGVADKIVVLESGAVALSGPRAEVLKSLIRGPNLQAVRSQ